MHILWQEIYIVMLSQQLIKNKKYIIISFSEIFKMKLLIILHECQLTLYLYFGRHNTLSLKKIILLERNNDNILNLNEIIL